MKQKLQEELKNAPMDTPHVPRSASLSLNKQETVSATDIVLTCNNPEVDQHQHAGERKAIVHVIAISGKALMPCTPAKARKLLQSNKANVYKMFPFTIKLNFECENVVQHVKFVEDTGFKNIGFSAVTEKKELVSGTVEIDGKTSDRLTERKMYRRGRRAKLWYRPARFLNRKIKQGWLPPSTQRRYDAHLKLLKLYREILPIAEVVFETANFDIQKINNAEIEGTDYQQGDMYGYQNVRSYLMSRENGKCQLCKKEFTKGQPSHVHHCLERSKSGSNKPKNLAILHKKCHEKLHKKGLKLAAPKQMKSATFMSIIHNKFLQDIPDLKITFGYITFVNRIKLGLEKTHYNDAFVIAGGTTQTRISPIVIRQKHRNNRVLQLNRKGFTPSIRKQRYPIQPKDLVWIEGKKHVVVGVQNKGTFIKVENSKKVFPMRSIEKTYHHGTFAFN